MAVIVRKSSDNSTYLVDDGKIVALGTPNVHRFDVLAVSDDTFADLVTAYGPVIGG